MEAAFYTYLHCKPNGDPFYVGKGSALRGHNVYRRNPHHRNVVEKYGAENIKAYIFPCASEREAFDDEVQQIAQLRESGYELVNLTFGGEGPTGRVYSDETRAKMAAAHQGVKISAETIAKRSATVRGRKHSAKTIERMAEAKRGKPVSAETRAKIAAANIGRPRTHVQVCSPETRAKMRASAMGNKSALGHRLSDEAKAKISAANKRRYGTGE